MRYRGGAGTGWNDFRGSAESSGGGVVASWTGRPTHVGRSAWARRARPRTAQHHRPCHRRPADRERGRARRHRRERRVLRLRARAGRARALRKAQAAHALGQRDRAAPVRGPRRAMRAPAARRVCVRDLGRPRAEAVRRSRPLRREAAVLRQAWGRSVPGFRDQGSVRGRRSGALGSGGRVFRRGVSPAGQDAVPRCPRGAPGVLHGRGSRRRVADAVLGHRLSRASTRRGARRRRTRIRAGLSRRARRSRERSGCAPTCRSAAT